jgi:quinohemoprotein ethanol dehydrogenase
MTFEVEGEQYVSILAGWGGSFGLMSGVPQPPAAASGRLLTFKLGANETLPPIPTPSPIAEAPPRMDVPEEVVAHGAALYSKYCVFCHGTGMVSGGTVPDLRRLPKEFHDSFELIVRQGAFSSLGMPSFGDVLDSEDVHAIHAFVIEKAHEDEDARKAPRWWVATKRFFYRIASAIMMFFFEPSTHSA